MACILAVEDEADLLDLLKEELEAEGHEVITACDGQNALEKLASFVPEIIISDISMPSMDGFEFLESFRSTFPALADTPFLFLTALADREDELRAREYGVDDYLTKPIDFDMLHSVLATRLRQVARMNDHKEQQMLKLYTALSPQAAPPENLATAEAEAMEDIAIDPISEALDPPAAENAGHMTDYEGDNEIPLDLVPLSDEPETTEEENPDVEAIIKEAPEVTGKRVFGSLLRFPNLSPLDQKLQTGGRSLASRIVGRAIELLKRMVCEEAFVSGMADGEIVVSYRESNEAQAREISQQLSENLQTELLEDQRDSLKHDYDLTDEMIDQALIVSESLFEIKLSRDELVTREAFEKSVTDVIEKTRNNPRAPNLLVSSIKKDDGHLAQLKLISRSNDPLPICFFNYDEASKQKLRASFTFFGSSNREKASYLVDALTLDLMGDATRNIGSKDIAVVDVHFETLASMIYATSYIRKFLTFAENTPYAFMLNIRSTPKELTTARLEELLRPLGKYGARRSIQISPTEILAYAEANMPVACFICSYPDLVAATGMNEVIPKARQLLAKSGKLLVLRGVPDTGMIENLKPLGFDGYAVDLTRDS